MSQHERTPDLPPVPAAEPAGTTVPAGPRPARGGPVVPIALAAGVLAGLASWAVGEATLTAFRPPLERQESRGRILLKARYEDQAAADFKNAALAFTLLGAILGASLGLAGGFARGSAPAAIKAGLVGLALGSALAAGASCALLPVYFRAEDRSKEELSRDLVLPLLVHGGIWAAAGAGGGLAFGFGLGGGRGHAVRAGLGGLIGAALGAVLYEMIGAVAFPAGKTTPPLSQDPYTRLLARLIVTTGAGSLSAFFFGLTVAGHPKAQSNA